MFVLDWLKRLRVSRSTMEPHVLARQVLAWPKHDCLTLGQLFENVLIMGGTGSGKTSGSGATIGHGILATGAGMLVLTAKPDERERWVRYCKVAGREKDLIVMEPGGKWKFNLLDGELDGVHEGARTHNIVSLLTTGLRKLQSASGEASNSHQGDVYWLDAAKQTLTAAVDVLLLAGAKVTPTSLYRLITSAPSASEEAHSPEWQARSYCFQTLRAADRAAKSESQERDLELATTYFLVEYPGLDNRPRSSIVSMVTSMLDKLNRGILRELLASDTTFNPAHAAAQGKIIILDLPALVHRELGILAQVLVKTSFQRSIQRRDVATNPRPVIVWADEFQLF